MHTVHEVQGIRSFLLEPFTQFWREVSGPVPENRQTTEIIFLQVGQAEYLLEHGCHKVQACHLVSEERRFE